MVAFQGGFLQQVSHSPVQVASWVAQASFAPLGLTIAVAKDRAIESLMQARFCPPQRLGRARHARCSFLHCRQQPGLQRSQHAPLCAQRPGREVPFERKC